MNYSGALPLSLDFQFNDASSEAGRSIEIRSVKINDKYVNVGNYLSNDSLTKGQTATVTFDNSGTDSNSFIFDSSEPDLSEFTTNPTRILTENDDMWRIFSSSDDIVLDALGGQDTLYLGAGNDKVYGNTGNDNIWAGAGNDLISGGAGKDRIFGQDGADRLYGGDGNDRISGQDGNDALFGGDGNDRLSGQNGDDVIVGGIGEDKLIGGHGHDFLYGEEGNDQLIAANGNDTIDGGDGNDLIYAGAGDDFVNGGEGNDRLISGIGADIINGDAGDDLIYLMRNDFEAGERIYGGAGMDEIILVHSASTNLGIGIVEEVETLTGLDTDQNVIYSIQQALSFSTIDLGGGTDSSSIYINDIIDFTGLSAPSLTNVENGFITGANGNSDLTISGAQLDDLIFGTGTINLLGGTDVLRLTSTSLDFNTLILTDSSVQGLDEIDVTQTATDNVVDLSAQSEGFIVRASSNNDVIVGGAGDDSLYSGSVMSVTVADILAANPNLSYNATNGNFYDYVAANTTFFLASLAAPSVDVNGIDAHLMTILSASENAFGAGLITGSDAWVGGRDVDVEGTWRWTVGPGAGQQFSNGASGVNGMYENWSGAEPANNGNRDQFDLSPDEAWEAETATSGGSYILEWEGAVLLRSYNNDENFLNGGDGLDQLYGSSGLDNFIFDSLTAFNDVDVIHNFDKAGGDIIDVSDLLSGFSFSTDAVVDFVQLTESGGNTTLSVDADGVGGHSAVATLSGITGFNVNELVADGNLVLV